MHPLTHSQTHRLLATSQSHSTLVHSHPRHPSQLPGGPAEHTLQSPRALKVQANLARAAYLADPTSLPALDQLRHTAADLQQHRQQQAATDALRAGVLLHEYGDQSTYYFHHLHKHWQQATIMSSLQQQPDSPLADFFLFFIFFLGGRDIHYINATITTSKKPLADLCTEAGRQQADSIIVSFFSADSPTGMFKQLPTDMAAQQALLSSVDRQLPPEALQECEGPSEGITLAELDMTCQQLVIKLSQASIRQPRQRPDTGQHAACLFLAGCMWQSRC